MFTSSLEFFVNFKAKKKEIEFTFSTFFYGFYFVWLLYMEWNNNVIQIFVKYLLCKNVHNIESENESSWIFLWKKGFFKIKTTNLTGLGINYLIYVYIGLKRKWIVIFNWEINMKWVFNLSKRNTGNLHLIWNLR